MDHASLLELVAGGVLGDLDVDERRALDAHLPACDGCRSVAHDLADLIGDLGLLAAPRRAPETLGTAVMDRIRTEGGRSAGTSARR